MLQLTKKLSDQIPILLQKDPPEDYCYKNPQIDNFKSKNGLRNPHVTSRPDLQDTLKGPYNSNLKDSFCPVTCLYFNL